MTLLRKPKRAPGENPVLRRHFLHVLIAHAAPHDLDVFLGDLLGRDFHKDDVLITHFRHLDLGDLFTATYHPQATVLGRAFFRSCLRVHGIDPETGKMTPDGLAFFEQLVADQNARNRAPRARRRRAAASYTDRLPDVEPAVAATRLALDHSLPRPTTSRRSGSIARCFYCFRAAVKELRDPMAGRREMSRATT